MPHYATAHAGLFRSEDSGATWKGLHRSLKSWNVLDLAIDPADPRTLYAGTAIGIYKSADAGGSWVLANPDLYVSALALDPRSPSVLYAGTSMGVLKSVDGGTRWAPVQMTPDPKAAVATTRGGTSDSHSGGGRRSVPNGSPGDADVKP